MITPGEYKAEVFKIAGFALMTPIGRLILEFPNIKLTSLNIQFFFYVLIAILLFCLGIIVLTTGLEIITNIWRKKWIL